MTRTLFYTTLFLILVLVTTYFVHRSKERVTFIKDYDVSELNEESGPTHLMVDLVVIHAPQTGVTWEDIIEDFKIAKSVFEKQGVSLNLLRALQVQYPESWNGISIRKARRRPVGNPDFYDRLDFVASHLPEQAETIFTDFISHTQVDGNVIYVITISDLSLSWFEKSKSNQWVQASSKTSAISFPPYMYADRIPRHLRGLISLGHTKPQHKTLAHELGHKLINVSHEGLGSCPRGSGDLVPGLMGYGDSLEIYAGAEGRWHKERLLLSPFIYRLQGGKKVWNPDYQKFGIYDDPIYGDYLVKPACP